MIKQNSKKTKEWRSAFDNKDYKYLLERTQRFLQREMIETILHPLGFYELKLFECENYCIRLHYWTHEAINLGSALTKYHDHIWLLRSCVLFGKLKNVFIELIENAEGPYTIAEIVQDGPQDNVVTSGIRVSMGQEQGQIIEAGEFYSIKPRKFHYSDISISRHPVVTLVESTLVGSGNPKTLILKPTVSHSPYRERSKDSLIQKQVLDLLA